MKLPVTLALASFVFATATVAEPPAPVRAVIDDQAPGWRDLVADDFAAVNSQPDTWVWRDGVLHCTGEPLSVMRTAKTYRNFEMVVEWMHEKAAGNSGVFVWTTPESIKELTDAGKPGLPKGIEVQILDHGYTERARPAGMPPTGSRPMVMSSRWA